MDKIVISSIASVSPLGVSSHQVAASYAASVSKIRAVEIGGEVVPVAPVAEEAEQLLLQLYEANKKYQSLDRTVQLALVAARGPNFQSSLHWSASDRIGVNIGSSRGATDLLERSMRSMQRGERLPSQTSPLTTSGNISSWVAQHLLLHGLAMSHSVTCSTGLHAILNAIAWVRSGMADAVIAGASEAPLTPFTMAQMKAMHIYSKDVETDFPCRPLGVENPSARDGLALGEAAVLTIVESARTALSHHLDPESLIEIEGFGFAMESIYSPSGISEDGEAFAASMNNALREAKQDSVDVIVLHAPGTLKGDRAEMHAINSVFASVTVPMLTSTKWITGHTFAAAGLLGVELAHLLLQGMPVPQFPYDIFTGNVYDRPVTRVMVNAAGFGGNVVSIILKKLSN